MSDAATLLVKHVTLLATATINKNNASMAHTYAYWKQDKKLRKRYVGKSWEDYQNSKIAKKIDLTPTQYRKFKFVRAEDSKDNLLAKQYLEKLKNQEVSIDWAYRVIINSNRKSVKDDGNRRTETSKL